MPNAPDPDLLRRQAEAALAFTQFYRRRLRLLENLPAETSFSPSEARILLAVAGEEGLTGSDLARELDLDESHVSRVLAALEGEGLLRRNRSEEDRRRRLLHLTAAGEESVEELAHALRAQAATLLSPLEPDRRRTLVDGMASISRALGEPEERPMSYLVRLHRPGDLGWIVHRHGVLYHQEYGWDERFEGLVAGIVSRFAAGFDPERERCWIAERDGERVGSVMLVRDRRRPGVARLRLLLVEPGARGLGIGGKLVRECTRFARHAGYRAITLWTDSLLHAARKLYQREGYRRIRSKPHHSYGANLVAEDWELEL